MAIPTEYGRGGQAGSVSKDSKDGHDDCCWIHFSSTEKTTRIDGFVVLFLFVLAFVIIVVFLHV